MDFGSLAGKAKEMLGEHDDKVDQALEKAGEFAKSKFEGHDAQIDKVVEMGQNYDFGGSENRPEPA
ncbi:antitoxin [Pseudonocardia spinosispora]|uniref:antitoxin n=1 Tax=Pseudonocardia spinosispora TaxID=103441 RepID=UPI00040E1B59|nr:antitoxin [Pseudonocardia spinosispora]